MIRQFIRHILSEGTKVEPAWGLYTYKENDGTICGIVYDMQEAQKELSYSLPPVKSIIAICDIVEPEDPCNGAWEVKAAAGPGKIVYDLGYYMSPTSTLISDRFSMTSSAIAAWTRWGSKSLGKELDDEENPKNTDPNDNCQVWKGDPEGKIERDNFRYNAKLPEKSANAINKSYSKEPIYDWDAMKVSPDGEQSKLLKSASIAFFRQLSKEATNE